MSEQVDRGLQEILRRYANEADASPLPQADWNKQEYQNRVLAGITLGRSSEDLVSSRLYAEVGQGVNGNQWMIEALTPLPLISAPMDENSAKRVKRLLEWAQESHPNFRVVIAAGTVEHGLLGSGYRASYGSSGTLVSSIIRACVLLPEGYSWVTQEVLALLSIDSTAMVEVSETAFYKIDNLNPAK